MISIKDELAGVENAAELIAKLRRLIEEGRYRSGDRLPSIREIARQTSLAPGTVAKAISQLANDGAVTTEGRGGTRILGARADKASRPRLFSMIPNKVAPGVLDLSNGFPDSRLFIPISALIDLDLTHFAINNYLTPPVLDELSAAIDERFKVGELSLTITNGSLDAIDRIVATALAKGSKVAVEDPTFPPLIDILERHQMEAVPQSMDQEGVTPEALSEAIRGGVKAVILQLRCHNPRGITTSLERVSQLAEVLDGSGVLAIEDDHSGLTRSTDDRTLIGRGDIEVLRVVGFSKLYGPDLRIAATIGGRSNIEKLNEDRRLGPSWTSHLIQRLLARLMVHDAVTSHNERVSEIYRARMANLSGALQLGGNSLSKDGLNAWIPTTSESAVIADLARVAVAAAPGSIFNVAPKKDHDHIRVTTASLDTVPDSLLEVLDRWIPKN